jgi:hypothetical protein
MKKSLKKQQKTFATLEARLEKEANESDITDSDEETTEQSHFQFTQHIYHSTTSELNLGNVILLDNELTMDLFCNKRFLKNITKTSETVNVTSNDGKLLVKHKGVLPGYHKPVWFDGKAITNILAIHNVKKQY